AAYELKDELLPALEDYEKAIALEPRDATLYLAREAFRVKKGQLDEAIADYHRAIEKDFQFHVTFGRRAELRHRKADYLAALQDVERAQALAPKNSAYAQLHGDIKRDLEDLHAAAEDYGKALDLGQALESAGPRLVDVNGRMGGRDAAI